MLGSDKLPIIMLVGFCAPLVVFFIVAALRRPATRDLHKMFGRFLGLGFFIFSFPPTLLILEEGELVWAGLVLALGTVSGLGVAVAAPAWINLLEAWQERREQEREEMDGPTYLEELRDQHPHARR